MQLCDCILIRALQMMIIGFSRTLLFASDVNYASLMTLKKCIN